MSPGFDSSSLEPAASIEWRRQEDRSHDLTVKATAPSGESRVDVTLMIVA